MRQALKLHPNSRTGAVTRIEAACTRIGEGALELRYDLAASLDDLRLAPAGLVRRGHTLWQHSCFEAFLKASSGEAYYEFNFAPSNEWAVYGFGGYRSGMQELNECDAPQMESHQDDKGYELIITLPLACLAAPPLDADWQLGLSAVIEEMDGNKTYWALAHPSAEPDFHHPDSFAHKLSAPDRL